MYDTRHTYSIFLHYLAPHISVKIIIIIIIIIIKGKGKGKVFPSTGLGGP
jgi:hypothetical protein